MEDGPFEDVFPIEHGDIPLLSVPEGTICIYQNGNLPPWKLV